MAADSCERRAGHERARQRQRERPLSDLAPRGDRASERMAGSRAEQLTIATLLCS